jgi:hypothetical protein
MDVMFARSTDGGATWSPPVRLNDVATGWQWFATMSVAPNGRIDVVWNDTRDSASPNVGQLYYVSSSDGGSSWGTNQPVSPAWNSHLGFPVQQKIGDYYHMVSDLTGANLAWSATFNGEQDVWFTRIGETDCNGDGIGDATGLAQGIGHDANQDGLLDECQGSTASDVPPANPGWALRQNVPNPFNPATRIEFVAPPSGGDALLRIYDVRGTLVRTMRRSVGPGLNHFSWDGTDDAGRTQPSGVYVYRLEAPGFAEARRMVLVR